MAGRTAQRANARAPQRPAKLWHLRLYVAGQTPKSLTTFGNLKQICEHHLKDRYRIEVIDVYQQPILARDGQIVATPTLVREFPLPVRRLIGSLANTTRLFAGLDLVTEGKTGR